MASFNKVIIMGNLTRDPDVRAAGASGMKVARLGVAINERGLRSCVASIWPRAAPCLSRAGSRWIRGSVKASATRS